MVGDSAICALEECGELFVKRTSNMKFCCDEHCRVATNRKIMARYYAKRDRENGVARLCSQCQVTQLSRYNESNLCAACESKWEAQRNKEMASLLSYIDWEVE